jgi:glycosyltransferase involved in cell wall biosynthesis
MKILCIVDNFPPEVNALASRTYEHAIEWIKEGHQVTVVTCCPNFPNGIPYKGYKNRFYSAEDMNGIKVIRVWSYMAANTGFFKRIVDFISFAAMAFLASLREEFDVILTSSPQFFTNFTGLFLKIFKRKKWIMEVRDLWPESIAALNFMDQGIQYKVLLWLEVTFYNFSDKIIVVTDSFKIKLTQKGVNVNKISIVYNGVNQSLYVPSARDNDLAKTIGLNPDLKTVGYLGTLGEAQDIASLIPRFAEMKEYNFLIIGDGAQKEKISKLVLDNNYSNIIMVSLVPKEATPSYYSLFDYGLVPLRPNDAFKEVIPSKIFELASMNVPIVYLGSGEGEKIVLKYSIGKSSSASVCTQDLKKLLSSITLDTKNLSSFLEIFSRKSMALNVLKVLE